MLLKMENQLGEGEYHSNLTAEERLKVSYPRIVRWSVLVATLFHAAAFVVAPAWAPAPYELPLEKEPWSLFPPAPEYAIPPPVEHVKSQIVTEIEPSDNADAEITIPSTVFNVDVPPELPPAPKRPEYFMAYDKSPEIIYQVQPEYPEFARMSELEGLVGLTVGIDEFGNVLHVRDLALPPTPAFANYAADTKDEPIDIFCMFDSESSGLADLFLKLGIFL